MDVNVYLSVDIYITIHSHHCGEQLFAAFSNKHHHSLRICIITTNSGSSTFQETAGFFFICGEPHKMIDYVVALIVI